MGTKAISTFHYDPMMLIKGAFATECSKATELLLGRDKPHLGLPDFGVTPSSPQSPETRHSKLRAQILPWNPFFRDRARKARSILKIPAKGIGPGNPKIIESTILFGVPVHSKSAKYVVAGWWLATHMVKSLSWPSTDQRELPEFLPKWIKNYSLNPKLTAVTEDHWPVWTKAGRRYPDSVESTQRWVPINALSASLVTGFALPSRLYDYVRWYVLTGDDDFLLGSSNPLETEVDAPVSSDGQLVVDVRVKGLDTATVKEDWVEIWDKRLAPLLDNYYVNEAQTNRRREGLEMLSDGELTQALRRGRRGHKSDVKMAKYARFYRYWKERSHVDFEDVRVQYMNDHPEDDILKGGNLDTRTLKSNLDRVEKLMEPLQK